MECHRRPTLALQKFSEGHAIAPGFVLHRRHGACRDACKRELQTFGQSILLPGIRSRGGRVAGCLTYQEIRKAFAKPNTMSAFVLSVTLNPRQGGRGPAPGSAWVP